MAQLPRRLPSSVSILGCRTVCFIRNLRVAYCLHIQGRGEESRVG
jgi:hypothetical protein